ncbi:hypothetical protein ACTXT7_005117 [Hymenolepis weldensis]
MDFSVICKLGENSLRYPDPQNLANIRQCDFLKTYSRWDLQYLLCEVPNWLQNLNRAKNFEMEQLTRENNWELTILRTPSLMMFAKSVIKLLNSFNNFKKIVAFFCTES